MKVGSYFLITIFAIIVFPFTLAAQDEDGIPNPDFESWAAGDPVGWWTPDPDLMLETIYETGDAQRGNSAMCGEVKNILQAPIAPVALAGASPRGFAFDERPRTLRGWFQFYPLGGDVLQIDVGLRRGDESVAGGGITISAATPDSVYQDFLIQLNYLNDLIPDTCTILITIASPSPPNPPTIGSKFVIDNLWFGGFAMHSQKQTFALDGAVSTSMIDLGGTAEGADDFTVPVDETWTIFSVIACGAFSEGSGVYESTTINFLADSGGQPSDSVVATRTVIVPTGGQFAPQDFHFFWPYDNPVVLDPGTYWLNVVVTMSTTLPDTTVWYWLASTVQIGHPFHWRDSLDIFEFGLTDWAPGGANGVAGGNPDLLFELIGFLNLTVDVEPEWTGGSDLPSDYVLAQNYPNPFNPETTFRFILPQPERVRLVVYDQLGREVATVADRQFGAGIHSIPWNAETLSSGIYFYRMQAGGHTVTRKLTLMK